MGAKRKTGQLAIVSRAERALAKAETSDEILAVRKQAELARNLFRNAKDCEKALFDAACIRLRAERKLGDFLRNIELAHAAPGNQYTRKSDRSNESTGPIRLEELGLSKDDSSRAQKIAAIPEEVFEEFLKECARLNREPTMVAALRLAGKFRPPRIARATVAGRVEEPVSSLATLIATGRIFPTIYAAPPWPSANLKRTAGKRLVERLLKEPVAQAAADKAHLHFWTPNAYLLEALGLMQAWGFEHASTLVCVSPSLSSSQYWKGEQHFLLLGIKGVLPFHDRTLAGYMNLKRTPDSAQEAIVRRLEHVSPGPYLQVFDESCSGRDEWTCCGV